MRVWDTRSGSKTLKLRGHTDNIRALLLDSSGRFVGYNLNANETGLWPFGENIKDERMIISSGSFIK